ncbi:MAG TPA: tRNA lysidine(34) synthetase TilS [Candidatus Limnocylindria bacterium]|nr:tRNA lysidine(34) synthetase TilS [Candidatus Limnocylindria bacterium]
MTPSAIRATVRDYIRAHDILKPGPLVVAVSGGADSTALLLLLADLADEFGVVLHVAHFDHRTRPTQAAADADFVAKLANRVGAPIRIGRAGTRTKSEDDARRARYEFLRRAAREIGATAIATGHTRDDQAETVLLHLARGTGLAGLAGIHPLRDGIARPILAIGRKDTAAVCRAARIRPRVDPTNRSLKYARNRVRLNVIPELAKINPRATEAITRLAEAAAALGGDEERAVADALASATRGNAIAVDALADDELRGQVLALAWTLATARTLTARHRGALERLTATTDGTRSIDLPGGRAVREYGMLRIVTTRSDVPQDEARRLEPGREITWNGWRLALGVSGTIDGAQEARIPGNLMRTLEVRSRRPGDRLPGPRGRKLQDVFTDAKVPLALRRRWPVISTAEGVWWVPGLSEAPPDSDGTPLAVTAPGHFGNVRWSGRVRQVASKREPTAKRSRRGPSS